MAARARPHRSVPASGPCWPDVLNLSPADGRVAVSVGIGSGIGAIFKAPLGGAVLAAEIVYRDDIEVEALLPAIIASIISYTVFGAIEGYTPIFGYVHAPGLSHPLELAWFALIGICCGLVGLLYASGLLRPRRPLRSTPDHALREAGHRGALGGHDGARDPPGARHRLRLGPARPRAHELVAHVAGDRAAPAVRPDRSHRVLHRLGRLGGHLRARTR